MPVTRDRGPSPYSTATTGSSYIMQPSSSGIVDVPTVAKDAGLQKGDPKQTQWVGALIGAIGAIISAAISWAGSKQTADEAYTRQARENEKNRQFALQQQREQNDYNSPAHQLQMLIEAGLNPNLAYGQLQDFTQKQVSYPYDSATAAGISAFSAMASRYDAMGSAILNGMNSIYDVRNRELQNEHLQTQIDQQNIINARLAEYLESRNIRTASDAMVAARTVDDRSLLPGGQFSLLQSRKRNLDYMTDYVLPSNLSFTLSRQALTDKQREMIDKEFDERVREFNERLKLDQSRYWLDAKFRRLNLDLGKAKLDVASRLADSTIELNSSRKMATDVARQLQKKQLDNFWKLIGIDKATQIVSGLGGTAMKLFIPH